MKLSELGEFGLIRRLKKSLQKISPQVLEGIGDDAAALRPSKKKLLITTDMLLEGIHFDLRFYTLFQLGYKTLAVNISDIIAMGGTPKYFLLGLGIPNGYTSQALDELFSGIKTLAEKHKIEIIGGDTCASNHGLILSGTLLGETNTVIKRSGAKVGNGIFVTGTLGDSAMGLMLLKRLKRPVKIQNENLNFKIHHSQLNFYTALPLFKKHLMPEPRFLKRIKDITAMIDISDGLLIDLCHICEESNVGAKIYLNKIPISKELLSTSKLMKINPIELALKGGEDYELLFTAPAGSKVNGTLIGEITRKGRVMVDESGKETSFRPEGYEHFKQR
ncbi:MAG TPA: thiamine-phosphate kinase [Nitrospiraceae bacterium]|nr:thiamine-phosphate kinase [Nitrospiraceae bacterium]